jgi:hypothetical protein
MVTSIRVEWEMGNGEWEMIYSAAAGNAHFPFPIPHFQFFI